ncbi:CPBP family intramembrane metalloprotease [Candidatus Micrarchaeota archaeon]|nr:CPBP family intramembrane metalloprotease [Candidatus Micrarchaeota archaeon]
MWILREKVNDILLILLFSSFLLILFTLPEINSYSFNEYIIGISIIFLLSLFILSKYGFKLWSITMIFFLIFSLIRDNMILLAPSLIFLCFPFYWESQKGKKYTKVLSEYGLYFKNKFSLLIYGIVGFFGIVFLVVLIGLVFYLFGLNDQQNVKEVVKSLPLISIPLAIILAPLAEEIFFRGFLYKKIGIWISAVIFALLHFSYGSIVEIAVAFAIALFLTYLFIKTKSLWPSIIAHSLFNLFALGVMWLL